ncbi:hypothetical protein RZN05_15665 [Sphingomonas sp. HF-S4]|uniref:Uncharacterized protein n=1 Tax=Sphingomonas agrestis TaxID=3080540 RepID=A0ABU3YAK2_9SPHN|nr:hypothetical protein [Sphingomonas sp. HF-S4]MDV3458435.1 hypothetical protein [Sphingomonas sp. HF-S4]
MKIVAASFGRPSRYWRIVLFLIPVLGGFGSLQVNAQTVPLSSAQDSGDNIVLPQPVVPDAAAGRVGQRQTRSSAAEAARIVPMARLGNRVPNRIQSRIRNRIDENYDPRGNPNASFTAADERVRAATNSRRR